MVRVRPAEPQDVRAPHSKTIDRWIDIAKSNVDGPIWDINMPLRSLDYLLWEDKVECTLRVVEKEVSEAYQRAKGPLTTLFRAM